MPSEAQKLTFAIAYVASVGFVTATSAGLPDCVASSFGGGGVAHGFMSRAVYRSLFGALCAGLPLILLAAFCWLPRRFPQATNIPNRELWLAPEHRAELHARMDRAGLLLASSSALFLAAMHALILAANEQQPARLAHGPFFAAVGAFLAVTIGTALWLSLSFRKLPHRAR